MKFFNPISFTPMAVSLIVAIVYIGILTPLLVVHETVPAEPDDPTVYRGINLTEAWQDLSELTNGYHPYNSRRNDEVRDWLLRKIEGILTENGQLHVGNGSVAPIKGPATQNHDAPGVHRDELRVRTASSGATIFNDMVSNYTSTALTSIGVSGRRAGISTYFEGSNIIVYIRGTEDQAGDWWKSGHFSKTTHGKGGVMVNAHFDSVSTGYGATDDGMGVVTALQLVRYFSTPGNTLKKGIVALFNNNEEDGLYGATAFLSHPMATFVHTFLNLEGAGAGGRATLFRSTDTEVTRAYGKAVHPFGSVISSDLFSLGFIRSETDYVVFRAEGYRGLDVAFWEPRSRYHTDQDDQRHASKASLWHMLSASLHTVKYLTSDTSNKFDGPRNDGNPDKVVNGKGTNGVWFDLFGQVFAVFELRTLFAWSLTLLIAAPLVQLLLSFLLYHFNKFYFFSGSITPDGHDNEIISLKGWRGAFRFPVILIISGGLTVAAAFLLRKVNPMIIYSSQYCVWAMSMSLFFFSFWFLSAGCNFIRPSALLRAYSLMWMQVFAFIFLTAATVLEDRYQISMGYLFLFYYAAIFFAAVIGLFEMFALPSKAVVVEKLHDDHDNRENLRALPDHGLLDSGLTTPTENSPLLARDGDQPPNRFAQQFAGHSSGQPTNNKQAPHSQSGSNRQTPNMQTGSSKQTPNLPGTQQQSPTLNPSRLNTSFANRYRQGAGPDTPGLDQGDGAHDCHHQIPDLPEPYGKEQVWSGALPTWVWILQFLIMAPFMLVVVGQVGLLLVTATAQTGTDGSPLLLPYLAVAIFSILLLLPIGPFMHRITHHLPTFFLLVFISTLLYNLMAFPFSANSRYKVYFQQTVDLDSGINKVTIAGIEEYVREIVSTIPSAAGQIITCSTRPEVRAGLSFCNYEGIAPKVVDNVKEGIPPERGYSSWLTANVTRKVGHNKATFRISGKETKACFIRFDDPFSAFHVYGQAENNGKWEVVPETGSDQIKLWHRDWDREWLVDVEWPVSDGKEEGEEGRSGRVACLWSDHNLAQTIPALDEVQRFAPDWSSVSKLAEGLVEGSKAFNV